MIQLCLANKIHEIRCCQAFVTKTRKEDRYAYHLDESRLPGLLVALWDHLFVLHFWWQRVGGNLNFIHDDDFLNK